ncbi:2OG-Fe(II) oxygenase [Catenovulum agarivorans DS-2]|uniref:2OG-Fe(II) oxygenase n=1 Tax=Catenovulum agarivorans DS-2 TaxID=1328313 RepID=W7QU73_9ALTE|nr:alpha-ketoglutarate-dependent dioxygenase AlkB [Catenovulum agarivorans]EWH11383.1 2OG-Fe(II) oxygenase [Catenovulum agarivorans DS-2]
MYQGTTTEQVIHPQKLKMRNADVNYYPNLIDPKVADLWMDCLANQLDWQQAQITVYGKTHPIPRLQAFYAAKPLKYKYSGETFTADIWPKELEQLKDLAESICQAKFNCVLANYYRNGQDTMGWHADDEAELGKTPVIASFSFGVERDFFFKHRLTGEQHKLQLAHGSLLIMAGSTQEFWYHCLPKRTRITSGRINLTFRYIHQ